MLLCLLALQGQLSAQNNAWFDSWVFSGQQNEQSFRKKLKSQAEAEIRGIEQATPLTEKQKEKLRLAAEGDMARLFRDIDKARRATEGMQPDQNNINEIQKHLQPVQLKISKGVLGESSLFRSCLNQSLTPEQAEEVEKQYREERRNRLQTLVALSLTRMERRIPLLEEQRNQFMERMAKKLQVNELKNLPRQSEWMAIEYILYSFPESELSEFLDKIQIAAIKKNNPGMGMKNYLEQQGLKIEE